MDPNDETEPVIWWWVFWGGAEPYVLEEEELVAQLADSELDDSALVWTEGLQDWHPVSELPLLISQRPAAAGQPLATAVAGSVFGASAFHTFSMPAWELAASAADPFTKDAIPSQRTSAGAGGSLIGAEAQALATPDEDEREVHASRDPSRDPSPARERQPANSETSVTAMVPPRPVGATAMVPPPLAPTAPPVSWLSKFAQVLGELVQTERSYLRNLEMLLRSYRPALEPVAPTVRG